jgi:hypothetical protein
MSYPLPVGGYTFVSDVESAYQQALTLSEDSDIGFLLQVDAEIPEELHDELNCFPPMPYKRTVDDTEWSESFQKPLAEEIGHNASKVSKLVCDLHPKKDYILHHRTLQLYTSIGVKITKVHKVLKFNQSPFLKKFIDVNTANRNKSTSDLEKDFWKLFSNSCFGKMIEQVRDRQRVNVVLSEESSTRLTRKPSCQRVEIIDEGCTLHVMKRTKVYLDRPILTGT